MAVQSGQTSETVAHSMWGRCEVFGLGQDVPADVFLLSCWEMLGAPAESLYTTGYKTLLVDMPCVFDCWVQIHEIFEFCTGGSHQLCPSAICLWYHRMGKVILLGQESVEEGQRKHHQPDVSSPVEWGTLKARQFLCCISTERPRLL